MYLKYSHSDITGLILAGGRGSRMGGVDKGLLDYRGKALVNHTRERLTGQVDSLLLSANRSEEAYRALGFEPLADRRPDYPGPLAGLEAGLAACRTPYLLVVPCDTPDLPLDLAERLWETLQRQGAALAHASDPQRDHYLHALIPVSLAGDLGRYLDEGGRAVRHWYADKQVARASFDAAAFANLNSASELP